MFLAQSIPAQSAGGLRYPRYQDSVAQPPKFMPTPSVTLAYCPELQLKLNISDLQFPLQVHGTDTTQAICTEHSKIPGFAQQGVYMY